MSKSTICFIGKRPKDLVIDYGDNALGLIEEYIEDFVKSNPNVQLATSLSYGIEYIAGKIFQKHQLPYHVFLTFNNQEKIWPKKTQEEYKQLLLNAKSVNQVETGEWSLDRLKLKDKTLIEQSNTVYYLLDKKPYGNFTNKELIKINLNKEEKSESDENLEEGFSF
jgi:uncharacterized phage-like protein YoqJ